MQWLKNFIFGFSLFIIKPKFFFYILFNLVLLKTNENRTRTLNERKTYVYKKKFQKSNAYLKRSKIVRAKKDVRKSYAYQKRTEIVRSLTKNV